MRMDPHGGIKTAIKTHLDERATEIRVKLMKSKLDPGGLLEIRALNMDVYLGWGYTSLLVPSCPSASL